MTRVTGRNIYITDLAKVLARSGGPVPFAARAKDARMTALWVRVGRGPDLDKNFTLAELPQIRHALDEADIALWGWHVPFCADKHAARDEADKLVGWADQHGLAGILLDAEKTKESPRFRGGLAEAEIYAETVRDGVSAPGRGLALSSHDQPPLHNNLPFAVFLARVADNCPQVYYRSEEQARTRLAKSVHGYEPLETARDFKDRYKPTGNITIAGDIPLPDVATCLAAAGSFIAAVKDAGYGGYSFWCWDTAPDEIWDYFGDTPV